MMYFDFLKDHMIDCTKEKEPYFNWNTVDRLFVRYRILSLSEINQQEQRLSVVGYQFPEALKQFWSEIGCGYLCSNPLADNVLEDPKSLLDIYFSEGEWAQVKTSFNLFDANELPFFRTVSFNYLTIGLEEGYNLGKIYYNGIEIAPDLSTFISSLLKEPTYYQSFQLIG